MKKNKLHWIGLILSSLLGFFFAFNALVKLFPAIFYPQIIEQMAGIGLPASILTPIAILEALCVVTYLIPATSVLGAILFTGYLGGTILTHLRVDQPVHIQITLGLLLWLGIYLREPRLHALLPIRKKPTHSKKVIFTLLLFSFFSFSENIFAMAPNAPFLELPTVPHVELAQYVGK